MLLSAFQATHYKNSKDQSNAMTIFLFIREATGKALVLAGQMELCHCREERKIQLLTCWRLNEGLTPQLISESLELL